MFFSISKLKLSKTYNTHFLFPTNNMVSNLLLDIFRFFFIGCYSIIYFYHLFLQSLTNTFGFDGQTKIFINSKLLSTFIKCQYN